MRFFQKNRKRWLFAALMAGACLLVGGYRLATWTSGQAELYDLGLKAYETGDMPKAIQLFDQSVAAYKREVSASWLHRFVYPRPSQELAAMASFQKAKAQLQNNQAELAVESFKDSLKLNPGDRYAGLSPDDAERLHEEAMVVKYDLEMLFKSRPDLAQQQGKGNGKGKADSNKPDPGNDPANQPGKGNRDDI